MWKMKFKEGHQRFKLGLSLLVALAIFLSLGMFLASYTMIKQIEKLDHLIPSLTVSQNVLNELGLLQSRVDKFEANPKNDTSAELTNKVKEIKAEINTCLFFAQEPSSKDKIMAAEMSVSSFLHDAPGLAPNAYIPKIRHTIEKVYNEISASINADEMDRARNRTREVANATIIISFFVFILIGGGLFAGLLTYSYISRKQLEKLDEVMGLSMVDELTKLYNGRYFEERLLESVTRVLRFKKPLAVIFFRVELPANMEKESRDMVIKEIASRLTKSTRAYDVNARFEGSTFASIIQEVGEKETAIVVKRIKNAIEQKEIVGKVPQHKNLLRKLISPSHTAYKSYATYVRGVFAAEIYKDGIVSVCEFMNKGAMLLEEAETAKNQIKIAQIKGKKADVNKRS